MAIPYNTTVTGTSIRDALDRHLRIKHGGTWQHCEDVQIKHSGAWRDTKEVWIKSGGTWRLVHEGCLLYTSPSPRDVEESRMPSSA